MIRNSTLPVTALAAAVLAPAVAFADIDLRGAPTLRLVGDDRAQLQFTTDHRLARKEDGSAKVRVSVNGRRVSSIAASGRHGSDFVYRGTVSNADRLTVGKKYTVRVVIADQSPITRQVKLHPQQR